MTMPIESFPTGDGLGAPGSARVEEGRFRPGGAL